MWKVAKLSHGQLLDVRSEDVLANGWFRVCETYRGGGGYDRFPILAERYFGQTHHLQFIVQLYGCHLDCPYCYVTREGVWGDHRPFSTQELITAFSDAHSNRGTSIFHLMGGSPALQLRQWPELLCALGQLDFDWVFHSDLLLTEGIYSTLTLRELVHPRVLLAVNIKGLTQKEHLLNTRRPLREDLLWRNLGALEECGVPYYVTFTNVDDPGLFWEEFSSRWPAALARRRAESFSIGLINYAALPLVDEVPWGGHVKTF